jgi:hypothetical protein
VAFMLRHEDYVVLVEALRIVVGTTQAQPRMAHLPILVTILRALWPNIDRELRRVHSRLLEQKTPIKETTVGKDLSALKSLIKMIADAVNDTEHVLHDKPNPIGAFSDYSNLISDIFGLIPSIGAMPGEIESLTPEDIQTLVNTLVGEIDIPEGKAKDIVNAATKAVNDIITVTVTDIKAVFDATKEAVPVPQEAK